MKQPFIKHCGSDNFVLSSDEMKDLSLDEWYLKPIRLLDSLSKYREFEFSVTKYQTSPGLFVTDGVEGFFKGKRFSIWSDEPGKIVVKYIGKYVDTFIHSINEQWLNEQT